MGKAIQSKGGTGRLNLINKWKKTKWQVDLKTNEFVPCSKKRKCDNPCLLSENAKRVKLEKQLKDTNKCLREVTNQVEK